MEHCKNYFSQAATICEQIDFDSLTKLAAGLRELRERGGRLFVLGVGGSAANASHAVNDFRKLCGIETYAPTDNVSELTARTNDEGWETVFEGWLKVSRANDKDALLVFSVGGGNEERNVSVNLVRALQFAKSQNTKVYGIVGHNGGYTAKVADAVVRIPLVDDRHITPHTEAFHSVVQHCLVSHPELQIKSTKW